MIAPEPPTNHCCPLLTEQGTAAFHLLFAKVIAVPAFPSIKTEVFDNGICVVLPTASFLVTPSIDLRPIFGFVTPAIDETLLPMAGHTVAG